MSNLIQRASSWLHGMRAAHAATPIVYARGASSATIPATVGKTVFQVARAYGLFERTESRDYLVAVADLVLDGAPAIPRQGDRIKEGTEGGVEVYEVMAPGGEPHYRFSDPHRQVFRIHTKHIGTEE